MPDRTTPDRTPGSALRRPRVLERLVVVAAVAAVLVAVGAWIAMNRPDGSAEAAGASAAADTSGGSFSETSGAPADTAPSTGSAAPTAAPTAGPTDAGTRAPGTTAATSGSRTTASAPTPAARAHRSAPLSPTTPS